MTASCRKRMGSSSEGAGVTLVQRGHGLQCELRSHLAFRVAPAVGQRKQA